jgi:hypothetical protein
MASGSSAEIEVVEGISIVDDKGNRSKYFNIRKGKIEDIPSQKMVFDKRTGKLMVVVSETKAIFLDNEVFTEIDEEGFFLSICPNLEICGNSQLSQPASKAEPHSDKFRGNTHILYIFKPRTDKYHAP